MSQILTALLDSQSDTDLGDLGYATTQCDSTQVDSDPGSPLKLPDIDNIDVCSTDEDVDTTASEGFEEVPGPQAPIQAIETCLRHRVGLKAKQNLHPPAPRIFNRQAEAICCLEALVSSGRYKSQQLGLFSREFTTTGCRSFFVDTHAGFAVTASPQRSWQSRASLGPRHLYEVLLENKPCWLYFDLEFSRVENPDLDPQAVASAFLELLNQFCDIKFGHAIDPATFYDLDSTNTEKFSKHIIIKRLQSYGSACNTLAFPNNAQAGYFVKLFMDWVRQQREAGNSSAPLLFAAKPKGKEQTRERDSVSVVDESVYTRNRCFRVLFSTKFGKKRPLLPTWSGQPALQLLDSLASFVPEGTSFFRHVLIPATWHHQHMRANKSPEHVANLKAQPSKPDVVELPVSENAALFRHLIELWDDIRQKNEPGSAGSWTAATRVQRSLLMGDFMVVALTNNRFCFKKGASHKSNGVYLVINPKRWVVYQKCHDVADCPDFRSHEFALPQELCPKGAEQCEDDMGQEVQDQDPISQELLTQIFDPETPGRTPCGRCGSRSRSSSPKRRLCRTRPWPRCRSPLGESHLERHADESMHQLPCR